MLKSVRNIINKYFHWIIILPATFFVSIVVFYPAIYGFYLSFFVKNVLRGEFYFTGFSNYIKLFHDPVFWESLKNTFLYSFGSTFLTFTLSIVLGISLTKVVSLKPFFMIAILAPWVVPVTASTIAWKWILNSFYGVFNYLLTQLGMIDKYVSWLEEPSKAMIWLIIVEAWYQIPLATLIIYSGLQRVPDDLYEAAEMDGANFLQRFRYITLNIIKPEMLITLVITTMFTLREFNKPWILTGGGPGTSTEIFGVSIYKIANRFLKQGYGSALGEILLFIIIILVIIYFKLFRNEEGEGGVKL